MSSVIWKILLMIGLTGAFYEMVRIVSLRLRFLLEFLCEVCENKARRSQRMH